MGIEPTRPQERTDECRADLRPGAVVRYTCPGEAHSISRAVHYARLAAFYPACVQCPHRSDAGHLPRAIVAHFDRAQRRGARVSPLELEGVRGVYLNELTRPLAEQYAAAFGGVLWERQPMRAALHPHAGSESRRRGPTVAVGQDDRACAADLVVGVAAALRRMGCHVVDVGTVSTSCFWYAVEHLESTGGVYVTGAGGGPSEIGLDFVDAGGIPWSRSGSLERLAGVSAEGLRRTSRVGGSQRAFRIRVPYEAGLLKHFHGLRPLTIGLACLSSVVEPHLMEVSAMLPCRVERIACPAANDTPRAAAQAVERLSARVRAERWDAGVVMWQGGLSCRVLDENGAPIAAGDLAARLGELVLMESKSQTIMLDAALGPDTLRTLERPGRRIVTCDGTREAMARGMQSHAAAFGCDSSERFWIGDGAPRCDGLTTLARILQWLSRQSAPASALRVQPR